MQLHASERSEVEESHQPNQLASPAAITVDSQEERVEKMKITNDESKDKIIDQSF